jgi:hypothetical protein
LLLLIERALKLAQKAISLEKTAYSLDTLAAAYAEVGDFARALKTQQEAIKLLLNHYKAEELKIFKERLATYQAKRPWREKPKGKP